MARQRTWPATAWGEHLTSDFSKEDKLQTDVALNHWVFEQRVTSRFSSISWLLAFNF